MRFLAAIFIFGYSCLNAQWTVQYSNVNEKLWGVTFIDTLHGWAVGENSTIINTTDGGDTWQIQISPLDSIKLEEVCFVNDTVGYIVGQDGTILATRNGGSSWILQTSPVNYSLFDLTFVNEDTGWIAGSDVFQSRKHGVILHTINGGQTWDIQFEIHSPTIFDSKLFRGIRFLDDQNGWAIAGDYIGNFSFTYIYHTNDSGNNWNIIGVASNPFSHISTVSIDTLWGCGAGFGSSYDSGQSWNYNSILGGNAYDIAQINGKSGWMVESHLSEKGIFYTEDGGINWEDISAPDSIYILALSNIGNNLLWGVGQPGMVLKYFKPPSDMRNSYKSIPRQFILSQNYPNPFNASTNIAYSIDSKQHVLLRVFNVLGKEISTLVNEEKPAGAYIVVYDASRLSSGIYFYQLQAGDFSETKKMILMR